MSLNDTVSKYLLSLENSFLKLHGKSVEIKDDIDSYKYISELVEVLDLDKFGFCQGVLSLDDEQREWFRKVIGKAIPPEMVTNVVKQSRNYYYLNKDSDLKSDKIDVSFQMDEAEKVLSQASEEMKTYLARESLDEKKEEFNRVRIQEYDIIQLGSTFIGGKLMAPVENINLFYETVRGSSDLEDEEKTTLIGYVAARNLELYNKQNDLINNKAERLLQKELQKEEESKKEYSSGVKVH